MLIELVKSKKKTDQILRKGVCGLFGLILDYFRAQKNNLIKII